jgi:hypothetical protein
MPVMMLGGSGWRPSAISGLTGWYSADFGTLDIGGDLCAEAEECETWVDQSGQGNDFAATANPPLWKNNIHNGWPALEFLNASQQSMVSPVNADVMLTTTAKTIFMVVSINASPRGIYYCNDDTDNQNAFAGAKQAGALVHSSNWDGNNDIATKAYTEGDLYIHTHLHGGGNVYCGVSDTRTASLGSAATGATSDMNTPIFIGRDRGSWGECDISELLFYNVALSEANRKLVEQYLAAKYFITLPY